MLTAKTIADAIRIAWPYRGNVGTYPTFERSLCGHLSGHTDESTAQQLAVLFGKLLLHSDLDTQHVVSVWVSDILGGGGMKTLAEYGSIITGEYI